MRRYAGIDPTGEPELGEGATPSATPVPGY